MIHDGTSRQSTNNTPHQVQTQNTEEIGLVHKQILFTIITIDIMKQDLKFKKKNNNNKTRENN
jgi:hypothetical protein